jgi:hypothetical protein
MHTSSMLLPLVALLGMPFAFAQSPSSGKAVTRGACSPAVSGSKNSFVIKCGIDSTQGKKMLEILNKVLANQIDPSTVMAKLDEISKAVSRPAQSQTCIGGNCVQGDNFAPQVMNQYGAAKLTMTDVQRDAIRDAMRPYSGITISVHCHDATTDSAAYAEKLANAFRAAGIIVQGPIYEMRFQAVGAVPEGLSAIFGDNRVDAANALAAVMISSQLVKPPISGGIDHGNKDRFEILIAPNR